MAGSQQTRVPFRMTIDYRVVLDDLKEKRRLLDAAIAGLEMLISVPEFQDAGAPTPPAITGEVERTSGPEGRVAAPSPKYVPVPPSREGSRNAGSGRQKCSICGHVSPGKITHSQHMATHPPVPVPPPLTASQALQESINNSPSLAAAIKNAAPPVRTECEICHEMVTTINLSSHLNFRHPVQGPERHIHRWKMDSPKDGLVRGACFCGEVREDPADPTPITTKRPKCPRCKSSLSRDRNGYWCDTCKRGVDLRPTA